MDRDGDLSYNLVLNPLALYVTTSFLNFDLEWICSQLGYFKMLGLGNNWVYKQ